MALNIAIFYEENTDWLHGNQGILAHRCHCWDAGEQGTFQAQGTAGRKAQNLVQVTSSHKPGSDKLKGKNKKKDKQQSGGIKEVSSERVHKSATHPQSDVICFTHSAFHLQCFLFFPIRNPYEIIYFPLLSSISKCPLLSSTLCPFLPTHCLLTSIVFSPDSSLPSLTLRDYVVFFLPV